MLFVKHRVRPLISLAFAFNFLISWSLLQLSNPKSTNLTVHSCSFRLKITGKNRKKKPRTLCMCVFVFPIVCDNFLTLFGLEKIVSCYQKASIIQTTVANHRTPTHITSFIRIILTRKRSNDRTNSIIRIKTSFWLV